MKAFSKHVISMILAPALAFSTFAEEQKSGKETPESELYSEFKTHLLSSLDNSPNASELRRMLDPPRELQIATQAKQTALNMGVDEKTARLVAGYFYWKENPDVKFNDPINDFSFFAQLLKPNSELLPNNQETIKSFRAYREKVAERRSFLQSNEKYLRRKIENLQNPKNIESTISLNNIVDPLHKDSPTEEEVVNNAALKAIGKRVLEEADANGDKDGYMALLDAEVSRLGLADSYKELKPFDKASVNKEAFRKIGMLKVLKLVDSADYADAAKIIEKEVDNFFIDEAEKELSIALKELEHLNEVNNIINAFFARYDKINTPPPKAKIATTAEEAARDEFVDERLIQQNSSRH